MIRERGMDAILFGVCYRPAVWVSLQCCFIAHGLRVSGDTGVQAGEGDTEEHTPHVEVGQ